MEKTPKEKMLEKAIQIGIAKGYRLSHPEDWYNGITAKELHGVHGYYGTYNNIIRCIFPNYEFVEWKFNIVSQGYWSHGNNLLDYLKWLENQQNWSKPEDWYGITEVILTNNYSFTILDRIPLHDIPNVIYPDYDFKIWLFKIPKINWWCDNNNLIKYLKWLELENNWSSPEDWYNIDRNVLYNNHGKCIDCNFPIVNNIPKFLYPSFKFDGWKFKKVIKYFWDDSNNCVEYLKWFEKEMCWKEPNDWYQLSITLLSKKYGSSLYTKYKPLSKIPSILYPDFIFYEWKFNHVSNGWWDNNENRLKYLKWLESIMNFKCEEDWYSLRNEDITNNNGGRVVEMGMLDIVKTIYPNYEWDEARLVKSSKTQAKIFKYVKSLYPNNIVLNDDRKTILNPNTNCYLELDIYIPELKIAIEYDGEYHYIAYEHIGGEKTLESHKNRDTIKDKCCKELNIRLIRIPYYETDIEQFLLSQLN